MKILLRRSSLFLILLALLLVSGLAQEQAFIRSPYLGLDSNPSSSVALSWKVAEPLAGVIHYATASDYVGKFTSELDVSAESGSKHHVYHALLTNLKPDTEYVYQVELEDSGGKTVAVSAQGHFRTAAPDLDKFTFAVYGDTRTYPQRHRLVIEAMMKDKPRLVVHTGDLVEFGGLDSLWDERFFWAIAPLARDVPFLAVLGNHEQNSPEYYEGFVLPPGGGQEKKEWWSVDYGIVHLVGLDTNVLTLPHGFARMEEQVDWLKEDLATARERGARFIFVFFHHPLFSSSIAYAPGNTGLRQLWHPIFVQYGVDAVFEGHCHSYERLIEDGVNYIVTGGGGAPLGGFKGEHIPGSVKAISGILHYVRVTIGGDRATLEMIPVAKVSNGRVTSVPPEPRDRLVIAARR